MAVKDRALDLEAGSSQYAYKSSFSNLNTDFTFEAWVKIESAPATDTSYAIISRWGGVGDSSNSFIFVYEDVSSTKRLACSFNGTNPYPTSSGHYNVDLGTGTWHHIAVATDISVPSMKFYVDGSEYTGTMDNTGATTLLNNATNFRVGAYNDTPSNFYDGVLEDIRVWNDIRTGTEISDNYNSELVGNEAGLLAYYKMNDDLNDSTSNANNLTYFSGSPVFVGVFIATILDGIKLGEITSFAKISISSIIDGIKLGDVISSIKVKATTILDGLKLGDVFSSVDDFIARWTNRTKPSTTFTNRTKPSTTFTDRTKPTTTWTKIDRM